MKTFKPPLKVHAIEFGTLTLVDDEGNFPLDMGRYQLQRIADSVNICDRLVAYIQEFVTDLPIPPDEVGQADHPNYCTTYEEYDERRYDAYEEFIEHVVTLASHVVEEGEVPG